MATLEYFYDFTSPYSYLASGRVEEIAQRTGAELRWRPFLLGGVFKATGNRPPAEVPAKGQHMLVDLARWARRLGMPFRWPSQFPIPSLLALRCALASERMGRIAPLSHALFRAAWAEDRDIGRPDIVTEIAGEVGLDGAALVAAAPAFKAALAAGTQEAVERGAFGAPTFFVGQEMFLGNDRLDFVEEALRGALRAAGRPS